MGQAEENPAQRRAKINRETAKIPWAGLQRFFAQGRIVLVDRELDLVEIAALAADDRSGEIKVRMSEGRIAKVSDDQARRWLESDALLWTVVVKPWVFVQEVEQASATRPH